MSIITGSVKSNENYVVNCSLAEFWRLYLKLWSRLVKRNTCFEGRIVHKLVQLILDKVTNNLKCVFSKMGQTLLLFKTSTYFRAEPH